MNISPKHIRRAVLTALSGAVFVLGIMCHIERDRGFLSIHFLDVGQGDAMYIRMPNGRDMLIDAGPSNSVLSQLTKVMPWYDRSIDVVLETHPDADHIGGLPGVLNRYRVGLFIEPGIESKNAIDDEISGLLSQKGISRVLARRGMHVRFSPDVYFKILFPDSDVSGLKETNDASIVGQMVYGSTSIMLTGDSPKSVENKLVAFYDDNLKSQVLKAGHHGSQTSSGESFVRMIAPSYVVISAGKNNRYGHPHGNVVSMFKQQGIQIFETSVRGVVSFISDGRGIRPK